MNKENVNELLNEQIHDVIIEYFRTIGLDAVNDEQLTELITNLSDEDVKAKSMIDSVQSFLSLLSPEKLQITELFELITVLSSESDRGCSLMAVAYLDVELERLLKAFLVDDVKVVNELFNHTGALGTFSSRINLAYALGLISKSSRRNLHLLRKIRNTFAHVHLRVDFNDNTISSRCHELTHHGCPQDTQPRRKFIRAVMTIAQSIHSKIGKSVHAQPLTDYFEEDDIEKNYEETIQIVNAAISKFYENNPIVRPLVEELKSKIGQKNSIE